mgnify:CR=1 FL=1
MTTKNFVKRLMHFLTGEIALMNNSERYKIIRFFRDKNRPKRIVKRDLTLKEAQQHCSDPNTHKEGVWFDGYEKE